MRIFLFLLIFCCCSCSVQMHTPIIDMHSLRDDMNASVIDGFYQNDTIGISKTIYLLKWSEGVSNPHPATEISPSNWRVYHSATRPCSTAHLYKLNPLEDSNLRPLGYTVSPCDYSRSFGFTYLNCFSSSIHSAQKLLEVSFQFEFWSSFRRSTYWAKWVFFIFSSVAKLVALK